MNKVYIVEWHDWGDSGIDKIYTNIDKAYQYIKYRDKMTGLTYTVIEKEVEN